MSYSIKRKSHSKKRKSHSKKRKSPSKKIKSKSPSKPYRGRHVFKFDSKGFPVFPDKMMSPAVRREYYRLKDQRLKKLSKEERKKYEKKRFESQPEPIPFAP